MAQKEKQNKLAKEMAFKNSKTLRHSRPDQRSQDKLPTELKHEYTDESEEFALKLEKDESHGIKAQILDQFLSDVGLLYPTYKKLLLKMNQGASFNQMQLLNERKAILNSIMVTYNFN
jgi:hypothetical protein